MNCYCWLAKSYLFFQSLLFVHKVNRISQYLQGWRIQPANNRERFGKRIPKLFPRNYMFVRVVFMRSPCTKLELVGTDRQTDRVVQCIKLHSSGTAACVNRLYYACSPTDLLGISFRQDLWYCSIDTLNASCDYNHPSSFIIKCACVTRILFTLLSHAVTWATVKILHAHRPRFSALRRHSEVNLGIAIPLKLGAKL